MNLIDKKKRKLKAKRDKNNPSTAKSKAIVPSKAQRGFSTKKPPVVSKTDPN